MIGVAFHKIQGCGNDFVVAERDAIEAAGLFNPAKIKQICNRHFGVGSDGLMLLGQYLPRSEIEVLMYNPDGSEMGMCGNGIRCVVRYLCLKHDIKSAEFNFSVFKRLIKCRTENSGQDVEVDMGMPECSTKREKILIGSKSIQGTRVLIGNPHFVIFNTDLAEDEFTRLAPQIEIHPAFPDRTNVEYVEIINQSEIRVLVWERGVGWTLACGSGACAAAVVSINTGKLSSPCFVQLPGGQLQVAWNGESEVILKGPATEAFSGFLLI